MERRLIEFESTIKVVSSRFYPVTLTDNPFILPLHYYSSVTKTKKSITISGELDNVIARLASKLNQTTSELIEFRLREDPQIKTMLQELRSASEPPEYENKRKKSMIAS